MDCRKEGYELGYIIFISIIITIKLIIYIIVYTRYLVIHTRYYLNDNVNIVKHQQYHIINITYGYFLDKTAIIDSTIILLIIFAPVMTIIILTIYYTVLTNYLVIRTIYYPGDKINIVELL